MRFDRLQQRRQHLRSPRHRRVPGGPSRRRAPPTFCRSTAKRGSHALRTTLGTQLARAGVAPQVAQKIMRHSDYTTTLRHYTVLGLHDTSAAVAKLPSIRTPGRQSQLATGTCDHRAQTRPPVVPLSKREMGRSRATSRDFDEGGLNTADASETAWFAAQSDVAQRGAKVERAKHQ